MRRHCFLLIACLLCATSRAEDQARALNVFAAASLTEPFKELGKQFESAHPGVTVNFSFGASNQLRMQMEHGAAADVFASANTKEMDAAAKAGLVAPESVAIFARNRLIVIFPRENPAKLANLSDLSKPGMKLIVADAAVPVGKYSIDMLDAMNGDPAFGEKFKERVLANIVSREDTVKGVVAKIRLGAADAGIVYVSDVVLAAARELGTLEVPDKFNQIAKYPIAPLKNAQQSALAKALVAHVLSDAGQEVLKKNRFLSANDSEKKNSQ